MKALVTALFIGGCVLASGCRTANTETEESSTDLVILKAVYGVSPTYTVDVTDQIRQLAKSGSIRLHPQWGLGVDPAYGKTKRVTVAYRYKGRLDVASFDQFEEFSLPVLPNASRDSKTTGANGAPSPIPVTMGGDSIGR